MFPYPLKGGLRNLLGNLEFVFVDTNVLLRTTEPSVFGFLLFRNRHCNKIGGPRLLRLLSISRIGLLFHYVLNLGGVQALNEKDFFSLKLQILIFQ